MTTSSILEQYALNGKLILVTGASAGIGRVVAYHISALGGRVIISGRNENRLSETLQSLHGSGHKMIVAGPSSERRCIRLVEELGEDIDGVVHSAGILFASPAKYLNAEIIQDAYRVNLFAPIEVMTQLFKKKRLKKNCSIVFLSSFAARYPYALGSVYSSSKAALENYAKCLAIEHASFGLRSNSILPALVKTAMYDETFAFSAFGNAEERAKRYERNYLRGIGMPKDVANMVTFLLSDASVWVTGQSIVIDGGYLLGTLSKVLE